jgi:hypothetical protein
MMTAFNNFTEPFQLKIKKFEIHLLNMTLTTNKQENCRELDGISRLRWSSGYRACHCTQGSQAHTQLRMMDF